MEMSEQTAPSRTLPSVEDVADVVRPIVTRVFEQDKDTVAEDIARAVLALFDQSEADR